MTILKGYEPMTRFVLAALLSAGLVATAQAATVLTVTAVDASGAEIVTDYAIEDLAALPQVELWTDNDYIDAVSLFTGPRLRDVLPEGLTAEDEISLTALNDYSVTIPASDALSYDVILATTLNGKKMSVRDKGPIWVIYPMSDHSELQEASYNDRLIWQLARIGVK